MFFAHNQITFCQVLNVIRRNVAYGIAETRCVVFVDNVSRIVNFLAEEPTRIESNRIESNRIVWRQMWHVISMENNPFQF